MGAKAVSNLGELLNFSFICSSPTEDTALLSIKRSKARLKNKAWRVFLSFWILWSLGRRNQLPNKTSSLSLETEKYWCRGENRQEGMMNSRKGNWKKSASHHQHIHIRRLTIIYEVTKLWIISYRAMTLLVVVFYQCYVYVSKDLLLRLYWVNIYQNSTKVFSSVCLSFRIWEEKESVVLVQWKLSLAPWKKPRGRAGSISALGLGGMQVGRGKMGGCLLCRTSSPVRSS